MPADTTAVDRYLAEVRAGRPEALGMLFEQHRDRLWRMLHLRLDARLTGRLSPDDVLQEAFLEVARRIGEYLADASVPFYVWLRFLTLQRLAQLQRTHLGAARRDAGREQSLHAVASPSADSMAGQLVGHLTSPSQAAIRGELHERLRDALETMDPVDREVLALRHFEDMTNAEVAQTLGLHKDAASKRYVRALVRLREILGSDGESA
jgi:RNA polymerase sigma-70 factor (ECF subfamily)